MGFIIPFLTFIASLGCTLAIIVPLTGIIVRYRVNYNPKGLQLDAEGGAQPHTGPVVSFLGMFQRVYRLEGWAGLYKGFSMHIYLLSRVDSPLPCSANLSIHFGHHIRHGHGAWRSEIPTW